MKKRRFKVYNNQYRQRLLNGTTQLLKPTTENGQLQFSWQEVYLLAKASGLRSKKKRHIVKRFRLLMHEAIEELVNSKTIVDQNK